MERSEGRFLEEIQASRHISLPVGTGLAGDEGQGQNMVASPIGRHLAVEIVA